MLRQRKQLAAAVAKGSVHIGLEHCPRKRQPPAVWMQAWLAFACMGGSIHLAAVGRGKLVGGPGLQKSDWISIDDLMHAESTRRSRNAEVLQNHTQKVYYLSKLAFGF